MLMACYVVVLGMFNFNGLDLTIDQVDKVDSYKPCYEVTTKDVRCSLGALGQVLFQNDLKIEKLLVEGDDKLGSNVPPLKHSRKRYSALSRYSCS